ncbi:AAA family ATPase [Glycomyces sp. L485]|uniref:AAA family ATPase n=1 Tax=Glycomyces sp. L485 TaxID=2909235 RepID=UPI001F4A4540|nr:AAA family ATPase [Glycomyces sp. L485]MCH7230645.1 AAA family ATPase [Glycomyces sp. L485]
MPFSTATESASEVWSRGVELLGNGDLVRAADCFEHVLEYDPRAADAWLGIHACGEQQEEALLRMLDYQDNLGRLRHVTGLALESSFAIGMFVGYAISDAYDVWLAYVAGLIDTEQFELADEQLAAAGDQDLGGRINFLRTRCAFGQGEFEQVLGAAHGIEDALLNDEAQFYVAASLAHLETYYEALNVTEGLPTAMTNNPSYNAHVAFVRGVALGSLGEAEESAQAFQRAYRLAPEIEEFAERARAVRAAEAREAAADRTTPKATPGDELDADDREKLLEEAGLQLDAMIGLKPVKDQIQTLKAQFRMAALRKERGLRSSTRPQHFVFTGPPGTGKTTVARIMGEILAGLGLLEHGRVVETQRGDLVGGYLGHTAMKTREKIDEATGGVLFVDEAYSLANQGYDGDKDTFGEEAMQEILTAAENRRDRLVIVLAGYTDEIHELLSTNPGLKSRFSTVIEFPSYSAEELAAIATSILTAAGETLTTNAAINLQTGCDRAVGSGRIDALGNARFARELCHKASAQRDLRLLDHYGDSGTPTSAEMTTIQATDIANAYEELVD